MSGVKAKGAGKKELAGSKGRGGVKRNGRVRRNGRDQTEWAGSNGMGGLRCKCKDKTFHIIYHKTILPASPKIFSQWVMNLPELKCSKSIKTLFLLSFWVFICLSILRVCIISVNASQDMKESVSTWTNINIERLQYSPSEQIRESIIASREINLASDLQSTVSSTHIVDSNEGKTLRNNG